MGRIRRIRNPGVPSLQRGHINTHKTCLPQSDPMPTFDRSWNCLFVRHDPHTMLSPTGMIGSLGFLGVHVRAAKYGIHKPDPNRGGPEGNSETRSGTARHPLDVAGVFHWAGTHRAGGRNYQPRKRRKERKRKENKNTKRKRGNKRSKNKSKEKERKKEPLGSWTALNAFALVGC